MDLNNLFNPRSIAIVGASADDGTVGNILAKNILNLGYAGEVFLVNPKHGEVLGKKCYAGLSTVDKKIDLAVMAIPARFIAEEIKKNSDKIKNYVIISAGFSEIGEEGKSREDEIKKIAEEKNLHILGPNCLGFIIPRLKLNASFAGGMPPEGNIALITQSGALAVGIMDIAEKDNIKFSSIISIGNKVSLDETSVLEYLAGDEETKVIGIYLEGIKNGAEFIQIAGNISRKKPVVILKAGKTEKSQKAISSHTGALAGSDEIASAAFKKCGIIRAENMEEFCNILNLISQTKAPSSEQVAVITNAGGPGVLITDAFLEKSIRLADMGDKTKKKLKEFLPEESSLENPIDLLGDAREDRYEKALKILDKEKNIGSIISILTPQDQTPAVKIAKKIINFRKKTEKNISAVFIGGRRVEKAIKKLGENDIPNFRYPHQAVSALDCYCQWNAAKNKSVDETTRQINVERKNKSEKIIEKAKSEGRTALNFSESREIMDLYGIYAVESREFREDLDFSQIKYPAVVKVDSDKILHKTDKKALILGVNNTEELKKSARELENNFRNEKIIIQPMLPIKIELILGIKKDDIFGPIIAYGLGGIYAEVFKIANFIIPPSGKKEIENHLLAGKLGFLFSETRGQNPYHLNELSEIIDKFISLAIENPQMEGLDINPLLVYNDERKAVAVDVKILV